MSSKYAWSNILKGRDVLMRGARWRVGYGESIGVWNDAWLPSLEYPRVLSNPVTSLEDMKVNDLIDPVLKQWDEDLLQGLFSYQEVKLITSIPLCHTYSEDKLIWPYTSSGNYTVKSSYNFLAATEMGQTTTTNLRQDGGIWKLVWSLSVPNKVKNFLWQVCKEALPMKRNLRRRKIIEEDTCDHCKSSAESEFHALWECSALTTVWNSVPKLQLQHDQNVHMVSELIKLTPEEGKDVNLLAMILWTVWYLWNKLRTTNEEYPISQVSTNAKQALTEYHQANQVTMLQYPVCTCPRVKWSPPPAENFKVNFDGATFKEIRKAELGAVIWNSLGQPIASLSELVNPPYSSNIVEAMAASRAIYFSQEIGLNSFILEGDSKAMIKCLRSDDNSFSPFGHILAAAKATTETNCCISFSHIRKLGNSVAHNLAKHARHVRDFSVWMEDVPPHLQAILSADNG